jgi:predicted GIY-YIG superfamily endonuclease
MTNMKTCNRCHKVKDTTQFSKCKVNKDGLQYQCKQCNSETNLKFRTEINPQHHKIWQDNNWDTFTEYMRKYRKADKGGIIYAITNPQGHQYIGCTEAYGKVRFLEHKKHYRQATMGKRNRLNLLHDSFDKYGIENHQFKVIKECPGLTRKQLQEVEKAFITLDKFQNISLNTKG